MVDVKEIKDYGKEMNDLQLQENKLKEKIKKIKDKDPTVLIRVETLNEYYEISKGMLDLYNDYSTDVGNQKIENDSKLTHELFRVFTECNLNYLSYYLNYNNNNLKSNLEKLKQAQEESNKNVMTIMGIFLAIFSVIGVNSSVLVGIFGTLEGISALTVPIMINSFVLIIIAFIFSMIKDDGLKKMICRLAFPVIIFLIVLLVHNMNNQPKKVEVNKVEVNKIEDLKTNESDTGKK